MSRLRVPALLLACLAGACTGPQVRQPVEMLDERTGMTVAALPQPLQLVQREVIVVGRRPSFAYLGPVEWNRMGSITQGLWLHLAQGQDQPLADIKGRETLSLSLDDGALELRPATAPALGTEPYRPPVPWGQSAYYGLTVHELRRLAASSHIVLRCLAADGSTVSFTTPADPRPQLQAYLKSRTLTGD